MGVAAGRVADVEQLRRDDPPAEQHHPQRVRQTVHAHVERQHGVDGAVEDGFHVGPGLLAAREQDDARQWPASPQTRDQVDFRLPVAVHVQPEHHMRCLAKVRTHECSNRRAFADDLKMGIEQLQEALT